MLGPPSELLARLRLEFPASVVLPLLHKLSQIPVMHPLAEPARVALAMQTSSCFQTQRDELLVWSWGAVSRQSSWVWGFPGAAELG